MVNSIAKNLANKRHYERNKLEINAKRRTKYRENINNYREKCMAKGNLREALIRGRAFKFDSCQLCGTFLDSSHLQGHHANYDRPYDVVWLCQDCHKQVHSWLESKSSMRKSDEDIARGGRKQGSIPSVIESSDRKREKRG